MSETCKFCENPSSFQRRTKDGVVHRACTLHDPDLEAWVREENGWPPMTTRDPTDSSGT